jgi:hypothetical protein
MDFRSPGSGDFDRDVFIDCGRRSDASGLSELAHAQRPGGDPSGRSIRGMATIRHKMGHIANLGQSVFPALC